MVLRTVGSIGAIGVGGVGSASANNGNGNGNGNEYVNPIIEWNEFLIDRCREDEIGVAEYTFFNCLLNLSIYDAVNAIERARGNSSSGEYLVSPDDGDVSADTSLFAAANNAAREVFEDEFNGVGRVFGQVQRYAGEDGDVKEGREWGQYVAKEFTDEYDISVVYDSDDYDALVDSDGRVDQSDYDGERIGVFRDDGWGTSHLAPIDSWTNSIDPVSYRPDGPPSLDSDEYAEAVNEVKKYGDDRVSVSERPTLVSGENPVETAEFWRGGGGTIRPSGRWILIAIAVSKDKEVSISESAQLFAHLGMALGDSGISTWNAKYHYGFWRPRRAIWNADEDGNSETSADPEWDSIAFGGSPEYSSGLAKFGGAAKAVLTEYFGDDTSFDLEVLSGQSSDDLEWKERSFDSFSEALDESIRARIYTGNHFRFTLEDSRDVGVEIGSEIVQNELN